MLMLISSSSTSVRTNYFSPRKGSFSSKTLAFSISHLAWIAVICSSSAGSLGGGARYENNWLILLADHRKIGRNFNPEVGFIERTDCICDFVDGEFKIRPHLRGVREMNFEGFIFHAPDTAGVLQTQEWQGTYRIDLHNGSYSDDDIVDVFTQRITTAFNIYKNVVIPSG